MSCHGVEGYEEESKTINAKAAPYLKGLGSKLNGDQVSIPVTQAKSLQSENYHAFI